MSGIKTTRCGRGHRWTKASTGTRSNGQRYCKTCSKERQHSLRHSRDQGWRSATGGFFLLS